MQPAKPCILYLDLDAEDSFTISTLLMMENYEPITTNFASEALQLAESGGFDLYILSRRFPVGAGMYLCQKLHEISPRTPMIFLSDESEAGREGIRSGSEEYVLKSKDARELLAAVHQALDGKKSASMAVGL